MTTNNLIIINSLCDSIYQTLFLIHQNHPEWLKPKFRNHPWHRLDFQTKFKHKLKTKLEEIHHQEELLNKVIELLNCVLLSAFFTSPYFHEFINQIISFKYINLPLQEYSNNHHAVETNQVFNLPIAILLLDIENLYIDINSEKMLGQACYYPIKIKFAFANWRNLGKKDVEFYERGYELLHVPPGKNNADLKMISFGSSIWLHHPNVKEVLICSSDGDLNHLSTSLQNHGITVYKVSRRNRELVMVNNQTSQTYTFSIVDYNSIPKIEECTEHWKSLIIGEQRRTKKTWVKLTRLKQMFKKKFKLTIEEVIDYHFPGKNYIEVLKKVDNDLIIHQTKEEEAEIYVTIFGESVNPEEAMQVKKEITTAEELEKQIAQIVKNLTKKATETYIPISQVASEFQKIYQHSVTQTMQKLQLGKKFTKLLESYSLIELKKEGKIYYVTSRKN